jgi:hypothetical protein
VSAVRSTPAPDGTVTVEATVGTSAHRRLGPGGPDTAVTVAAQAPREVMLTLVPAADGRHWLVRDTAA